jgi:hypothetical protein
MKSSRLARLGHLLTALLAVFAFGAIAASSAQAITEGPFWTVEGKALGKNETREITIKAYEGTAHPIVLEAELLGIKAKVECHLASVVKGGYLAGGSPGTTEEVATFSDCTVVNNGSGCKVKEPIETQKIRGELVVSDEHGHFGQFILVEFDPFTGTEGKFAELIFEGSSCTVKSTEVGKGLVVGSAYRDPGSGTPTEQVKTKGTAEASSFLLRFPDEFTDNGGVESVWLLRSVNVFELVTIKPFKAFGNEAHLTGTVLVLLARNGVSTGEKYGQEV